MGQKWYIIHTYSGFEMKVKNAIMERAKALGIDHLISEVLVPTETVEEMIKGERRLSARKFYPGYVLVRMELTDDSWHLVKDTPKVTGFIGNQRPQEVKPPHIEDLRKGIVEGAVKPRPRQQFQEGDEVRVVVGAFANFSGTVQEVKPDKQKLKVMVSIFGRPTPVELDFSHVEKR